MGHARFLRGLADAASHFVDDDVVVRGVAAQQATQAYDGIIFFSLGESPRRRRNFKSAGYADDFDVLVSLAPHLTSPSNAPCNSDQ